MRQHGLQLMGIEVGTRDALALEELEHLFGVEPVGAQLVPPTLSTGNRLMVRPPTQKKGDGV